MKYYQIVATGIMYLFEGGQTFYSKKIFANRELITEKVIENFKNICCNPKSDLDLNYLDKKYPVKINIVELETE
jgi:hypothetical protein